ncbi:hypothetical protein CEUSTIGMA_g8327.t1 [Chlamydomonas eustigma]|uniref:Peroxisome biogenesis protein 12 n=1 Tax=Chlamydomonas eustigma TaxID=1157962 RepID=A0A250XDE0_9CHLO|nr:hypothetical protein CEUSTIGMA_g8327.t1 [Chlamydomonas eustigma]|eukprot:GAX80892.1 hypothetical protein CEUSTIGMA_g8327.t1 [Chlamydomonas eustigma]
MSFVNLGGDEKTKPTYFEIIAADQLVPSLKSAVIYTLSVFSQRYAWLHRLLQYEDEVLALLMFIVDWHSLSVSDATFAEALYGLKRQHKDDTKPRLTNKQRMQSATLQVLIPYTHSKAVRLYQLHADQGILGLALSSASAADTNSNSRTRSANPETEEVFRDLGWVRRFVLSMYVRSYPWIHAVCQGIQFTYHVSYLLGPSLVHRPALHLLGLHMSRVSARDLELMTKEKADSRQAQMSRLTTAAGSGLSLRGVSAVAKSGLSLLHFLSDHHHNALMLAVFGFKALEWWFNSAEERLAVNKTLPPPPPPPAPRPAQRGVGLPADTSLCPICRCTCSNPAQVATSGYVFCYPCIFNYIMDKQRCPVSFIPASLDHIRKLYKD